MEPTMKPNVASACISRRAVLSTLALLPALSGTLLVSASAQAATSGGLLTSRKEGPAKQAIFDFVDFVRVEGRRA
jgi:hypothetical protein